MLIFRTVFLISFLIHCLSGDESVDNNRTVCGHENEKKCVIEAGFGRVESNETVDVFVKCSTHDELPLNRFTKIDRILWNGCKASYNLKSLGLKKIPWRSDVKHLVIKNFALGSLESGTFDGFVALEILSIQNNYIENLSKSCFRDLGSLKMLQMIENNLKWIDAGLLGDLPKLSVLEIHDSQQLLMANHQFVENQTVDNVKLEIHYIEMDLLEHLFLHVRKLSIQVDFEDTSGCVLTKLNGFEKYWQVENLSLTNFKCGFIMADVESIKQLELNRVVEMTYSEFSLKNLENLEIISLHQNSFQNFSSLKFEGNFSSLQLLNFSNSNMSAIDMRMFRRFSRLKEIDLSRNFLKKLDNFSENFKHVQIHVDRNSFDCSWLNSVASTEIFSNFVYDKNFEKLNINGCTCQYNYENDSKKIYENDLQCASLAIESTDNITQEKLIELKEKKFILKPELLMIIVLSSALLGAAISFISIRVYHRRQMLKQEPFYHLLRDSFIRPIFDVGSTLRRDFKEIIARTLPPTNYEHPISYSDVTDVTEMTDIAANTSNIYEEIPQKFDQNHV